MLPGFVDAHTHLGVWEEGEGWSGQDTNEMTDPVTAQVRALDAIYPRDIGFTDALGGGITTVCVNPGSGNVIGGHCVAVHTHGDTVDDMVLRSPAGLKSALGENPKRVYGDQKKTPSTRLGTAAVLREAFVGGPELPGQEGHGRGRRQDLRRPRPQARGARHGAATARSRGASTPTAPTTSPPPSGSPRSSATSWSSTTAPRRT